MNSSSANQFWPPFSSYVTDESEDDSSMHMDHPISVRFAASDQALEIPSRDSYSEAEIRAAWYKKEDYQAMKLLALETMNLHQSSQLPPGDTEHCMRGLEGRTHDGFAIVKQNRKVASFAVIDEQDRQDEMGISDPDLIAEAYGSCVLNCQYVAFVQGVLDAQEVLKDLLQEESVLQKASKPTTVADYVPVDQNALFRLLDSEGADDMFVESTFQKDAEEVSLSVMDWTAEAA